MMLKRWTPFEELRRANLEMDRLRQRFWGSGYGREREPAAWAIPLDVVEKDGEIEVHASLPSVDPKDVEVSTDDGVLTIRVEAKEEREEESDKYLLRERRRGAFYRAVRLPETVDAERAQAHYDRGVLTVTFPKAEGKKAHRIAVEVKAASAIEG